MDQIGQKTSLKYIMLCVFPKEYQFGTIFALNSVRLMNIFLEGEYDYDLGIAC